MSCRTRAYILADPARATPHGGARARASGVAVDEQLDVGAPGRPPCRYRARRAPRPGGRRAAAGEVALAGQQGRPHRRDGGDLGGGLGGARPRAERGLGEVAASAWRRPSRRLAAGSMPSAQGPRRHRAVEQAGIEMGEAEMGRQPPGERALAGGRRAVDGDHDRLPRVMPPGMIPQCPSEIRAPSPFISSTKPGKLVSMVRAVVDGDGPGRRHAQHQERHGDAVIERRRDPARRRRGAGGRCPRRSGCRCPPRPRRRRRRARGRWRPGGRFP